MTNVDHESYSHTQLETPRLQLSLLGSRSAPEVVDYVKRNNEHFRPTDPPRVGDYFTERFWSQRIKKSRSEFDNEEAVRFVISVRSAPQYIIGLINFTQIVRGAFQACYLGYGIDRDHQGQGYMTEALAEAIHFIFDEMNLHRIMANYLPENQKSARVLEKLGFVKEGLAKNYLFIHGQWQDHVLTSLLNPNWQNSFLSL